MKGTEWAAMIILVAFLTVYLSVLAWVIDEGSRGCFCDIMLANGFQARILDVDVDDILLLMQAIETGETIVFVTVRGPQPNVRCFRIKLFFKNLTKVFKRRRSVMNADGDNWRVGLLS